jgi:photosystem II stability/assembly factor-like uncharacterized protein
MPRSTIPVALAALTLGVMETHGQHPSPARQATRGRPAATSRALAAPADSLLVRELAFRSIGPAVMSGRIADIAVAENPRSVRGGRLGTVVYVAAATGGVWKSTNAGVSWTPVFDSIRTGSIGAVAVAPSNSEMVWVGTGEAQNMRSSSWGTGVYKSADGGRTWSGPMLPRSQHIGRIVVDPRDPDVVYVAAVGPLWAPGGERGLYKTTDGGRTWTNTKEISRYTGFTDIAIDPLDPDVLYAAAYMRERREYSFLPAGTESGIYKTTDAGRTWSKLAQGLPTGELGRIGLSVCRSRPATVYAVIHARGNTGGVYRTDDAGATWRQMNPANSTAWFYGQVRCDPTDHEHVYRLGPSSQESYDGGRTMTAFPPAGGVHADHHALWINPEAPEHLLYATDGGLYISHDRGRTWDHVQNLPVSQFYAISVDDAQPFYNVYGGLQDNQSWGGPTRTRNTFGPTNADWFRMAGGDGFYSVPDPWDHNIVYTESQNGGLIRYDARIGQTKNIRPVPGPGERFRYNWSAPILPSRHGPRTLYFAANVVFRSPDRGDSWETISPDLTRNIDRNTLPMRGVVPDSTALGRHEGTAEFSNITSIDESPLRAGLLVAGTDDGLIQVTRDGGRTWTKTDRFPTVPETTYVSRVVFSRHNEGTIYATLDGHRSNDFRPYAMRSTDYGRTWTPVTGNLPDGHSLHVIREHPRQANLLFVGSEFGVFVTVDGGTKWTQLRSGIPAAPVHDLAIQARENDLVVGTHGRGVFILDDLTPLEHLARARQATTAFLFPVRDALLLQPNNSRSTGMGTSGFTGQNPAPGARIAYLLNEMAGDTRGRLEIIDAAGTIIRELPVSRQHGLFRPVWDMRVGPPLTGPVSADTGGRGGRGGRGGGGGGGGGRGGGGGDITFPAQPGSYRARLTITPARGTPVVLEQSFALRKDPMVILADAELRQLYTFRLGVAQLQRELRETQATLDSTQRRLADAKRVADSAGAKVPDAAKQEMAAIEKELAEVVAQLGAQGGGRGGGGGGAAGGRGGGAAPAGGRGGRAGGGGGAEDEDQNAPPVTPPNQTIQVRLGTTTELLNATFNPSPAQRQTVQALPAELRRQSDRLRKVTAERLPALLKALRDAGVEVRPG